MNNPKARIVAAKPRANAHLHITHGGEWTIHGGSARDHKILKPKIQSVIAALKAQGKTLDTAPIHEIEALFEEA